MDYALVADNTVSVPRPDLDLECTKVTMTLTPEGAEWGPGRSDDLLWTGDGFTKVRTTFVSEISEEPSQVTQRLRRSDANIEQSAVAMALANHENTIRR